MSHLFRYFAVALVAGSPAVYTYAAPSTYVGSTENFSVTKTTEIPGSTLKPGDYTIKIVDQLSDRMIVRIDKADGNQHAIFLGVPHAAFGGVSGAGVADWKIGAEGTPALRGFQFANGSTVEFVYPKAEAATIATKNAASVVAIDPDSEGRPKLTKMSDDDIKVVTLWMLSLTTAPPNSKGPALLAQRYTGDQNGGEATVAQSSPAPPPPPAVRPQPSQPQEVASLDQAGSSSPARAAHPHVVSQLPHTASDLPLLWLAIRFARIVLGDEK
jgi:hypothetical protein